MSTSRYSYPHFDTQFTDKNTDERYERDILGDIKHGLDLIFELQEKIDKFHPRAKIILEKIIS